MRARKCCKAFTLVELLVVIGIIALLIAILLPALNKARTQAIRIKDLAQMRSLAQMVVVYATNNKGHNPIGAMSLSNGGYVNINEEYITEEMYIAMGFPELQTLIGGNYVWNGTPLPKAWVCPANPDQNNLPNTTVSPVVPVSVNPIVTWGPINAPGLGYPAVSKYACISTSYVYAGTGIGLPAGTLNSYTTPVGSFVSGNSYIRTYNSGSSDLFAPGTDKVLFADKVYWHYQNGFFSNHGISRYHNCPSTPGLNEVFADGHGAWIDLSHVGLLTAPGAPQANAASNPYLSYPPKSQASELLNQGYPGCIHTSYPFYELWYW